MSKYVYFFKLAFLLRVGSVTEVDDEDINDDDPLYYTPHPQVKDVLQKHLIIPELLRYGPEYTLELNFGNKSTDTVKIGEKLTPENVQHQPSHVRWPCREDAFHSLVAIGLDVPSRVKHSDREWRHWIVVNIPATNISAGEVLVPYEGPGLNYENGVHRVIFLVYEQPWRHKICFSEEQAADCPIRAKFNLAKFTESYDIGDPVAVNFFLVETN